MIYIHIYIKRDYILRCLWVTNGECKSLQRVHCWMLGFSIIHIIGVDSYSKVYLYLYWHLYMNVFIFVHTYCHLYFYHWQCTCIASFYKTNLYIGGFKVCCEYTWFLVWTKGAFPCNVYHCLKKILQSEYVGYKPPPPPSPSHQLVNSLQLQMETNANNIWQMQITNVEQTYRCYLGFTFRYQNHILSSTVGWSIAKPFIMMMKMMINLASWPPPDCTK